MNAAAAAAASPSPPCAMHAPNCFRWPKKWGRNGIRDEERSRGKKERESERSPLLLLIIRLQCSGDATMNDAAAIGISTGGKVLTYLLINKYICRGGSTK